MLTRLRRLARGPGRVRVPQGLLFAPQDLRTADPAVAAEMAAGLFVLGDGTLVLSQNRSPFAAPAPSRTWAEELYGFGWLRHLRAADTGEARDLARALVADALASRERPLDRGVARAPATVARRVASLLTHSPLLLTGAEHAFYRRYLRRLGRDAAVLDRSMRDAPVPTDRLAAAIGLLFAALCCRGLEGRVRAGTRVLAHELDAQILSDGGHVGRNPATLIALLLDLLPLRLLFTSRSVAIPDALDRAVDRMMPMLHLLRLGDGDLALFNGMGLTPIGDLATILAQDKGARAPGSRAPASGYERLEAAGTVVIAETGPAPPLAASASAHAGALSFEMSSGRNRIVVNAGTPPGRDRWWDAARLTDAHSTLVLGGEPSGHPIALAGGEGWAASFLLGRLGPVLLDGVRDAGSDRGLSTEGDQLLSCHHDGYRAAFGAIHTRRLRLAPDGRELEGEDALAITAGGAEVASCVLRFHLHPAVRAAREEGGGGILLDLPGDERWHFGVEAAAPRLERSLFFAVSEGRRATSAITVDLPLTPGARHASVRWIFVRA